MIISEHLVVGRKLYEPNPSALCINVYAVIGITDKLVMVVPYGEYRQNRGRGEAGSAIDKKFLLEKDRDMFVSEEEAVYRLLDLIEEKLSASIEGYEWDLLAIPAKKETEA